MSTQKRKLFLRWLNSKSVRPPTEINTMKWSFLESTAGVPGRPSIVSRVQEIAGHPDNVIDCMLVDRHAARSIDHCSSDKPNVSEKETVNPRRCSPAKPNWIRRRSTPEGLGPVRSLNVRSGG